MAIGYGEPRSIERPYGWVMAAASITMMAVGAGASYLVILALKPIAAEFGWPRAVPSLCYSLALLGAGLGGLIWGSVADRIGMRRPALLGGCMVAFGAWLASIADGVLTLYIAHGLFIGLRRGFSLKGPGRRLGSTDRGPSIKGVLSAVPRLAYRLAQIVAATALFLPPDLPPDAVARGDTRRDDGSAAVPGKWRKSGQFDTWRYEAGRREPEFRNGKCRPYRSHRRHRRVHRQCNRPARARATAMIGSGGWGAGEPAPFRRALPEWVRLGGSPPAARRRTPRSGRGSGRLPGAQGQKVPG